jgi:hypothetical protein
MHLEVITSKQKEIFDKLKKFPEYYLTGGTALALQIGHRISLDFDLFSKKDIPPNLLRKVRRVFQGSYVKVIISHSEQLSVEINKTKIDFVKYSFPLMLKTIKFKGLKIAQIPDIALMKAFTLSHRGEMKDYVDLYFILKKKYLTLKDIEKMSEKKYGDKFNFRLFLEQLTYLEDVEEKKINFLQEKVTKKDIQKFFEKEIRKIKI